MVLVASPQSATAQRVTGNRYPLPYNDPYNTDDPYNTMENSRDSQAALEEEIVRTRAAISADPLLKQIRRLSRSIGAPTSISDSSAVARAKLRAYAPHGFDESLRDFLGGPKPMFRVTSLSPPRQTSAPSCQSTSHMLDSSPVVSAPVLGSRALDHVQGGETGRLPTSQSLPHLAERPATSGTPVAAAMPPNQILIRHPERPVMSGAPAAAAHCGANDDAPQHAASAQPVHRKVTYLGDSQVEVPSAADYLAELPREPTAPAAPPNHAVVLSRVAASTERLMLEHAHAAIAASADADRGVESARLETLRTHLGAMRATEQHSKQRASEAERHAARLAHDLNEERERSQQRQHKSSQLHWKVSKSWADHLKGETTIAFMTAEQKRAHQRQAEQRRVEESAVAAYQQKLEDAEHVAQELALSLKAERERCKKLAQCEQAAAEKLDKSEKTNKEAWRKLAASEKMVVSMREQIRKTSDNQKVTQEEVEELRERLDYVLKGGANANFVSSRAGTPNAKARSPVRSPSKQFSDKQLTVVVDAADCNDDDDGDDGGKPTTNELFEAITTSSAIDAGRAARKKARTLEGVPAGRMLTLTRIRATDIPSMDRPGRKGAEADPYVSVAQLGPNGEVIDEARTSHFDNVRNAKFRETLRLFIPEDDDVVSGALHVRLMDYDKTTEHDVIGEVNIALPVGKSGKIKIEVPTSNVSSLRPHVAFRYESTPRMFFEKKAFEKMVAK